MHHRLPVSLYSLWKFFTSDTKSNH